MQEHDDMALPAGMTCGVCENWHRCKNLICTLDPAATRCDFAPSRFRPNKTQAALAKIRESIESAQRRIDGVHGQVEAILYQPIVNELEFALEDLGDALGNIEDLEVPR